MILTEMAPFPKPNSNSTDLEFGFIFQNKNKYISSGINFQYPDATTIWLVKVNKVLPKNSATPLEFLKPTIKQIIINNRKLELVNTIEKEITNDAINDKKYEIYK